MLIVCTFGGAIAIVYADRDGHRRSCCDGLRRPAQSGGYGAAKLPLTNVQLDWPPEMDTLKINLPRDQEGYGGFEYTDEKLSTRRIQWCGEPSSIFVFGVSLNNNFPNNDNGAWVPHH